MRKVLTIAGSDCSGGAGIQADLKTMAAHKVYGMSVITALTAQNTTGVYEIMEASPAMVGRQIDCVFTDIVPDSVKIGMVSSVPIIEVVAERLRYHRARNVVLDPLMVATSGSKLLDDDAVDALTAKLFPLADVVTPNIYEAEALCGVPIEDADDMVRAVERLSATLSGGVLIKGGHLANTADDLLFLDGKMVWIKGERIDNPNTHGTGCTLSAAIACNLAKGSDMTASVRKAKDYLTGALKAGLNLGGGSGPLDHLYGMTI